AGVTPPQDGEGAALSGCPRPSDLRESGLGNAGQPDFARPILVQGEGTVVVEEVVVTEGQVVEQGGSNGPVVADTHHDASDVLGRKGSGSATGHWQIAPAGAVVTN